MKLGEYLRANELSPKKFGDTVGVSRSAVWRWVTGSRLPTKHMSKIVEATEGQVQPNDFFEAA